MLRFELSELASEMQIGDAAFPDLERRATEVSLLLHDRQHHVSFSICLRIVNIRAILDGKHGLRFAIDACKLGGVTGRVVANSTL